MTILVTGNLVRSLKPSTQGLARIRQARQRITLERGWAIDRPQWLEQASQYLPLEKNGKGMMSASVGISTWKRFLAGKPIKATNFKAFCQVLGLNWQEIVDADTVICPQGGTEHEEASITHHAPKQEVGENLIQNSKSSLAKVGIVTGTAKTPTSRKIQNRVDWGEAMDVSVFYGRTEELATLKQWIVQDNCRLVGLLGMGGIGKTSLSVKFAQQVQHEFKCAIWRSLQNAPPVNDILATLIQILSNQQETPANLPENTSFRITRLIEYLRFSRCLIILDNAESIMQAGAVAFQYRPGYEGYGELIKRVGETFHRSCLILTSCEKPQELAALEGESLPVRVLKLTGLHEKEARAIFQAKGTFTGTPEEWKELIQHYVGNPLALNMVASAIRDVFGSSISDFVKPLKAEAWDFTDISQLLERQFNRLTDLELEVIYWLALDREALEFSDLKDEIISPQLKQQLPEILKCLTRKSLLEINNGLFTLQPMVMGYVTNLLIAKIYEEIETISINLLNSHALYKAQAKDSVRDTQIRLILKPINDRLIHRFRGKSNLEKQFDKILSDWQTKYPLTPGYIADNMINLLNLLKSDGKEKI
ncbi:NB-ARC domain-containing protein [Aerosakkonema sp. BLCC-F183]|uniref:NB-ARC domain-containing protein n=1 Tax=Aerosakkonema sp. BLCC-F183 TaxID=3342834 RepID=UPI0035B84550